MYFACEAERCGGTDVAFSEAVLQDLHNADLADTLGNLVNRALMMCHKFSGGKIGDVPTECPFDLWDTVNKMEKHMAVYKLDFAVQAAVSAAHDCNKYLQESAPWAMKDPSQETQRSTVVRTALEGCYVLAHLLMPVIPTACSEILEKLGATQTTLCELSPKFDNLKVGQSVAAKCILFQKIDKEGEGGVKTEKKKPAKPAKGGKGGKGGGKGAKPAKGGGGAAGPATVTDIANDAVIGAVDIRVGMMSNARKHPDSDKLFVEDIDVGDGTRQVCSGLYQHLKPEEMAGLCCVVCNLKKAKMGGVESNGMVLCASDGSSFELLRPPAGAKVGERVTFEGIEMCAAGSPNAMAKKKIVPQITGSGDLKTNADKAASWRGATMLTSAGPVTVASLASAGIS